MGGLARARPELRSTSLKQCNSDGIEGSDDRHEALRMIIPSASFRVALTLVTVTSLLFLPTLPRAFFPDVL